MIADFRKLEGLLYLRDDIFCVNLR